MAAVLGMVVDWCLFSLELVVVVVVVVGLHNTTCLEDLMMTL
jgi:hypothetical protein